MGRAQSRLSGGSDYAQKAPRKWLAETWKVLCQEKKVYIDFRVDIASLANGGHIGRFGGVWHIFGGEYIPASEIDDLELPEPPVRYLTTPQEKLFSIVPLIFDPHRMVPLTYVACRGGRRSSKTEGVCILLTALAAAIPYAKLAVFTLDYKSSLEILDKLSALLPEEWIARFDAVHKILFLRNGATVHFFTENNPTKAGRSYTFDFVLLDEFAHYRNARLVLEGVIGSIVERDGVVLAAYTPPPEHGTAYWEEVRAKSPDPEIAGSMKVIYFGASTDNQTLTDKAKRKILLQAKRMSKDQYGREFLGKWGRSTGAVFYDYKPELHEIDAIPDYLVDITAEFNLRRVGYPFEWIGGMDFNENPMTMTWWRLYWSPAGGHMIQHHELFEHDSNTEKFIHSKIFPFLRSQYPGITSDKELAQKVFLVVDASAYWQGNNAGRSRDAVVVPATKYLIAAGFRCVRPKAIVRGVHTSAANKSVSGNRNPARTDRMESMRARLLSRFGWPNVQWLPSCPETRKAVHHIQLVGGSPDNRSEYAHFYDASSYPIYNLYPVVQLYDADPDHLTKTYHLVHQIGQEKLTKEQRWAHPITQQLGKDLVV